MAAVESSRVCETQGCSSQAKLQCPTCIKLGIQRSYFCSQVKGGTGRHGACGEQPGEPQRRHLHCQCSGPSRGTALGEVPGQEARLACVRAWRAAPAPVSLLSRVLPKCRCIGA